MNPNPFIAADEFNIERDELLAQIEQLKATARAEYRRGHDDGVRAEAMNNDS